MTNILVLWKKELSSSFLSPIAYIAATFFLAVMGLIFYFLTSLHSLGVPDVRLSNLLVGSPFYWMTQMVIIPLLTMRLFADERRMGTLESLLTAPISDAQVVIGKFAGVLTFYILIWLPTLLFYAALDFLATGMPQIDYGILAATYLGILLGGAFFLSVGLLCSMTTSNQIIAAIMCFTAMVAALFAGFSDQLGTHPVLQQWSDYFSFDRHLREFAAGTVDSRPVLFYLSGIAFCLFASTRLLESRQWR